MTASPGTAVRMPSSARFMVVFGGIVVAAVLLYYAFLAIDGWGLVEREATGVVTEKEYREAGTTYQTQKVGDRILTLPQSTPAMYILTVEHEGKSGEALVEKNLHEVINVGDHVAIVYQQRRLTGKMQISRVTR